MNDPTRIATLRELPAIDEVLRAPELEPIVQQSGSRVKAWARAAVDKVRSQIHGGEQIETSAVMGRVLREVALLSSVDRSQSMRKVINATGILLHTNLGRAPLAPEVVSRMSDVAGYTNVELDLESGKRSHRGDRVCDLLAQLTGSQGAVVVNNCAAATVLALQGTAQGREVLVSRGQLVEIGGGFRLPEVFASAGVRLKEVGTTNRTYLHDYANAITDETGAIIRVHRSNFAQTGFVTEPTIEEMVQLQRSQDVPVIDDLGSGCIELEYFISNREMLQGGVGQDPSVQDSSIQDSSIQDSSIRGSSIRGSSFGEPSVRESVKSGADLCLFSGDKLFGGPQCGIIVGKTEWLERLRRSPLMRAFRLDKMTLAALEATVEMHLTGRTKDIPFYQMINKSSEEIRAQCVKVAESLRDVKDVTVSVEKCVSRVGGGSMAEAELLSYCVCIESKSSHSLAYRLRTSTPAVQCRQSDRKVILDLRTLLTNELGELTSILRHCCSGRA